MNDMTLFQMKEAAVNLYEMLQNDEIDEQTLNDTIESIGIDEKLEDYIYVIKTYEADMLAYKLEIDRLTAKKKSAENNISRMKQAIVDFMTETNQKKARAGTFSLSLRETESVELIDESKLSEEYLKPQPPKPDKMAIKKAIKAGIKVEGAYLIKKESVVTK